MDELLNQNDPILRQVAESIPESEFGSRWLNELIQELFSIMKDKSAVGVAAPQIGVSKRVIVFSTAYTTRQNLECTIADTALINPSFKVLSEEIQIGYEGCLNCEDIMAEVPRAMDIAYCGYNLSGQFIAKKASGLEARILQHEIDHLNGYLFLDRIQDKDSIQQKQNYSIGFKLRSNIKPYIIVIQRRLGCKAQQLISYNHWNYLYTLNSKLAID